MDDKLFNELLAQMDTTAASPPATPPAASPQPAAPAMSDDAFNAALAQMDSTAGRTPAAPVATAPAPSPAQPPGVDAHAHIGVPAPGAGEGPILPPVGSPEAFNPGGGQVPVEPGLSDPSAALVEAPFQGAAKAVYETKDFVLGETPQEQRSSIRKAVEAGPNAADAGIGYSFSSGLAQFATGMLGAGKLMAAAKGIKAVAGAVEGVEALKGGAAAIESAKAAATGAIAFDPHGERLSNIVQAMPALANPINGFLAAKPGDSAALGRMKNAMESLGLDAAMMGVLTGGVSLYKAVRGGDLAGVKAASEETSKALNPEGHAAEETPAAAAAAPEATAAPEAEGDHTITVTPKAPEAPDAGAAEAAAASGEPVVPPVAQAPAPEVHTDTTGSAWEKAAPGEPWLPKAAEEPTPKPGEAGVSDPSAPQSDPVEVKAVANATQGAGPEGLPAKPKFDPVSPEAARAVYEGTISDMDALAKFKSWDDAVDNGHIFGKGGSIPYQKLVGNQDGTPRGGLDAFITNAAEQLKDQFDAAKGGAVLDDARVDRLVAQRVALYGEDPAALYGVIQKAGKDANNLVANMQAAYAVAQRGYQDAYTLAARIKVGALDDFAGSQSAAMEGLRQRLEVASNAWASGQAMRAASGRALRRLRAEHRMSADDLAALKSMDDDALVSLLNSTEGDPQALQRVTRPSMLRRITDGAQYLYVNNLLWGWRTHFVNLSTNAYMLIARPMERILGAGYQSLVASVQGDEAAASAASLLLKENARQYTYMGSSLHSSWTSAVQTWRTGDSVLAPHSSEVSGQGHSIGTAVAQLPFKPWVSLANTLHNALLVGAPKVLGFPTRALGMVDELVQTVVYQSKVQAAAHTDGVQQGLKGDDLTAFVRGRLYSSFDDAGRAIDPQALQEAKVAAFQQDLLPGTLGAWVQQGTSAMPWARFILPFVKTPTNVLRYGVKMTPVLNLAQKEYRAMLGGELGTEVQAQAVGQMAMGSLFMGTAAFLANEGRITGGGPSDPKLKAALMATGWQPYSFVWHNADGSKEYINYGRYDPVATPFGMIADIMDVLHADPDGRMMEKTGSMILAVGISLAKSITQKTYLKSLDDTIQALMDPDKKMTKLAGTMAANMIPASSLLRTTNPDPSLRDARNFLDYSKATVPGFSETLPAKRDAFGDPLTVHKGLWVDSPSGIVDSEILRMADKPGGDGQTVGPPAATVQGGVDLRDVTMVDGRNAYEAFQVAARQPTFGVRPIKEVVAEKMQSDAYKRAPDGDAATKGTKLAIIAHPMAKYREAAMRVMHADANVRAAMLKKKLAVAAAYAGQKSQQNPTVANKTDDMIGSLQKAFGGITKPAD